MNYQTIFKDDLINGEGVRVSLFVSGCSHGCKECFSESSWDYRSGDAFTSVQIDEILEELSKSYIDGLSLLGGDPLAPKNYETVLSLCKVVKEKYPHKNIWVWTGYTLEELPNREILEYLDVLVDGKFENSLKNANLIFRGSSNQRILRKNIDF